MAYKMILVIFVVCAFKKCVRCCCLKSSIKVNQVKFIDNIVQICISLPIIETELLKSWTLIVDLSISLCFSILFALYILKLCYQVHKCLGLLILDEVNPCYYEMTVFTSGYIICSKICFMDIVTPTFYQFQYDISFSLKKCLNLFVYLNLKWFFFVGSYGSVLIFSSDLTIFAFCLRFSAHPHLI